MIIALRLMFELWHALVRNAQRTLLFPALCPLSLKADPWDAIGITLLEVRDDDLLLDGAPWHCISSSTKKLV